MSVIHYLKLGAMVGAGRTGHEMGEWQDFTFNSGKLASECHCVKCGEYLRVEEEPAPNSIDVSGSIFGVACQDRQLAPYNLTDPQSGELIAATGEPITPVVFERWVSAAEGGEEMSSRDVSLPYPHHTVNYWNDGMFQVIYVEGRAVSVQIVGELGKVCRPTEV